MTGALLRDAEPDRSLDRLSDRLYDRFVDTGSVASLSTTFRARRWRLLEQTFPDLGDLDVIDLGGTLTSWDLAPRRPAHLTLVNIDAPAGPVPDDVDIVVGDACDVPAAVRRRRWDLVFSNSVIEHVGGHRRRLAFAEAVRSLAPRCWVQTPYRYFPIEPHFLVPGLQFLPTAARATAIHRWPLNKWRPADRRTAVEAALDVELLGRTELAFYFPDAELLRETVAGLTKSLVAVRREVG